MAKVTRKYAYPYRLHGVELFPQIKGIYDSKNVLFETTCAEIAALRAAYDYIAHMLEQDDFFATFASGGMVMLEYITSEICMLRYGALVPPSVSAMQDSFTLLPSPSWKSRTPDSSPSQLENQIQCFWDWLSQLPTCGRLVLADTTFSGKAINTVRNVLTDYATTDLPLPPVIELVGVRSSGAVSHMEVQTESPHQIRQHEPHTVLRVTNLLVPSLISEDEINLIGYTRIPKTTNVVATCMKSVFIVRVDGTEAYLLPTDHPGKMLINLLRDLSAATHGVEAITITEFDKGAYLRFRNQFENWEKNPETGKPDRVGRRAKASEQRRARKRDDKNP